jgi:hypothetical protein
LLRAADELSRELFAASVCSSGGRFPEPFADCPEVYAETVEPPEGFRVPNRRSQHIGDIEGRALFAERDPSADEQQPRQCRIRHRRERDARNLLLAFSWEPGNTRRWLLRKVAEVPSHAHADPFGVPGEHGQDLARTTLLHPDDPEQQVLRTNLVPPRQRLALRHLKHLLSSGRERYLPLGDLRGPRSQTLRNKGTYLLARDRELGEHIGRDPVPIIKQSQQQVLGPDRAVPHPARLLLGSHDDLARVLGESLKHPASIAAGCCGRKPTSVAPRRDDPTGSQTAVTLVLSALAGSRRITFPGSPTCRPLLAGNLDAVIATVMRPDHVESDALPRRERVYRRDVGPSRWLLAVVSFEQEPGRIITAVANRKDPKQWKP